MNAKRGIRSGPGDATASPFRACDTTLGNVSYMTGIVGLTMASVIVRALAAAQAPAPVMPQRRPIVEPSVDCSQGDVPR